MNDMSVIKSDNLKVFIRYYECKMSFFIELTKVNRAEL